MFFYSVPIWYGFVVGQAKLGYELNGRVSGQEAETASGMIRKSLDVGSPGGDIFRAFPLMVTNDLNGGRID